MCNATYHTLCDVRCRTAGVAVPIAFSASCREIARGKIYTDVTDITWFAYEYHGLYWYRVHTESPRMNSNSLGFCSVENLRGAISAFARSLCGRLCGIDTLKGVR